MVEAWWKTEAMSVTGAMSEEEVGTAWQPGTEILRARKVWVAPTAHRRTPIRRWGTSRAIRDGGEQRVLWLCQLGHSDAGIQESDLLLARAGAPVGQLGPVADLLGSEEVLLAYVRDLCSM